MNESPPPTYREIEGRLLGNTGWVALGHGGRQAVSFLVILVLARLLDTEDFGLVALAWVVLGFAEQIQETGIGQALIHRRHDVGRAAASALVFSSSVSVLLYGAVFTTAPFFARFLHAPELVDVLRVMALVLVFRGFSVVPGAILERDLDFRSRTIAELAATIAQVGVCLGLAFAGAGVWSLVFGHLALGAVQTTLYWFLVPWRPSLRSANSRTLRELMRYGRFIGAVNVLTIVSNTVDDVVVGRVLGTPALGVYSVVYRVANFPNVVLGHIVGRPMFSVYSMLQDDLVSFRLAYVRNLQRVALVAVPASVGLAIAAEPIVATLLGDKWLPGVPALHILAVYGLVKTFGAVSAEALKALGAPHLVFMFGVVYVVVSIPALIVLTRQFDLAGAALSMLLAVGASAVPMIAITARKVRLGAGDLARALTPALFPSALLAVTLAAVLVPAQSMPPAASLAVLISAGLVVYIAATGLFARSAVLPMWSSLRNGRRQ